MRRPRSVPFALRTEPLAGGRVEEAAPQARPVVERAGSALVQRMLGVPLERVAEYDVVGVQRRAVMELHAVAELAGPGRGIRACGALGGECRDRVSAFVAIERLVGLLASAEALAVGLVRAEQAEWLGVLLEDDGRPIGRLHPGEHLAAEDRRIGARDVGLEGRA